MFKVIIGLILLGLAGYIIYSITKEYKHRLDIMHKAKKDLDELGDKIDEIDVAEIVQDKQDVIDRRESKLKKRQTKV